MKRSRLPTKFRLFKDTRYAALPNRSPIIERQRLFSRLSKKMHVIGHYDVSSDDPVDMPDPSCLNSSLDLRMCEPSFSALSAGRRENQSWNRIRFKYPAGRVISGWKEHRNIICCWSE
jgi:hypothetical protein